MESESTDTQEGSANSVAAERSRERTCCTTSTTASSLKRREVRDAKIRAVYVKNGFGNQWDSQREKSERWRMTLFPLQAEISRTRDKDVLERLMAARKEVLFELLKYVFKTKRFEEEREDRSFYEL